MPHCVAQLQCLQLWNIYLVTCQNSPKTSLKRTSSPRKFNPSNATLHATGILARMAVATIIQTRELKAIAGTNKNVSYLIYVILCYLCTRQNKGVVVVVAYERLKTIENFKRLALKWSRSLTRGGCIQDAPNKVI